jgi:hypothetical protein
MTESFKEEAHRDYASEASKHRDLKPSIAGRVEHGADRRRG